jgi:hypothetical protein
MCPAEGRSRVRFWGRERTPPEMPVEQESASQQSHQPRQWSHGYTLSCTVLPATAPINVES